MGKIVYTKYANERSERFSVRTDIVEEENGGRALYKRACCPKGEEHISHIYQSFGRLKQELAGSNIFVNDCQRTEEGIRLEFVQGQTLQETLDGLLCAKRRETFEKTLREYLLFVKSLGKRPFQKTEAFARVFGEASLPEGQMSAEVTDIDMILSNILVDQEGRRTLIDYEWTFDFPVPIKYVIYRILHYYEQSSELRSQIAADNWYELMEISQEEKQAFQGMEKHFQSYVLGEYVPMRSLRESISPGYINIPYALRKNQFLNYEKLQVFYSQDGILREEDSELHLMQEGRFQKLLRLRKGCRLLRLDPGERCGAVKIRELSWDTGEACRFETNGIFAGEGWYFFRQEDPQIIIREIPKEASRLTVSLEKSVVDSQIFEGMTAVYEEEFQERAREQEKQFEKQLAAEQERYRQLEAVAESRRQELELMKSTKIWRLYRKYKALGRGD